ncbi:MAG: hypothetical protein ACXACC_00295 [Promethearchaeota archaeon]|jgi:hypothetical protein
MKKCFVISPIGEEGSKVRQHADDVFDFIIEPALKPFDIEPVRSDKIHETGKISTQIYNAIQTHDLCIVVLSFENPNVFYELAVAQCAVRPVIILIEEGNRLPFDIQDERSVFYDLKARSYVERTYINRIIEIIRKLEESDYKVEPSIPGFKPLDDDDINLEFLGETQHYGSSDEWAKTYKLTKDRFYLMGISLNGWIRGKDFEKIMLQLANNGCDIKYLIMHEENPALHQHIYEKTGISLEKTKSDINFSLKFYSEIANQSENVEVKQVLNGSIKSSVAINDHFALFMPHFYSQKGGYIPIWRSKRDSYLYNLLMQEFETLWNINK